jgi:hypothetical protein
LRQVMEGAKKAKENWNEKLDQVKNAAEDAEDKLNIQLQMVH